MTNGQSRSILELIDVIKTEFPSIRVKSVERDKLMPIRGTLSIAKAQKELGYSPKNPIELGIPKYIQWYRSLPIPMAAACKV